VTDGFIYHLALDHEWAEAVAAGEYRRSTLGRSLAEVGFVHCSFPSQAQGVADAFYRGREDVVLLQIDPRRLGSPVVVEGPDGGFPHVYGPVPVAAVARTTPVPVGPDGRLAVTAAVEGEGP